MTDAKRPSDEDEEDYANLKYEDTAKEEAAAFGRRKRGWLRWTFFWTLVVLTLLLLGRWLFTTTVMVPDGAMFPSIEPESELMLLKGERAEPGDLVLVSFEGGSAIRRVVAGPGETVRQTSQGIEVGGQLLARAEAGDIAWAQLLGDHVSALEMECEQAVETIAGRQVALCLSDRSERGHQEISLADDEIYVRCDNRAFCARRELSEGVVSRSRVQGRVWLLMGTRNDDDQPFYKRWFGRFESVN